MSTSPERFAVAKLARGCFTAHVVSRDSYLSRPERASRAARVALGERTWLGSGLLGSGLLGSGLLGGGLLGGTLLHPVVLGRTLSARALSMFCAILAVFVALGVAQAAPVHPLLTGGLAGACAGAGQAHVSRSGPLSSTHRSRALPAEAECEPMDDAEGEDSVAHHPVVAFSDISSVPVVSWRGSIASPGRDQAVLVVSSFWIGARPARGPPLLG